MRRGVSAVKRRAVPDALPGSNLLDGDQIRLRIDIAGCRASVVISGGGTTP
jgi:hypothetical protein